MIEETLPMQIEQSVLCFTVGLYVALFFWVWMIVDCVRHQTADRKKWLLIILVFNVPGAIYYFFAGKNYHMWQPLENDNN